MAVSEYLLGELDFALEHQNESLTIVDDLVKKDPDYSKWIPPIENQIGNIFEKQGQWKIAITHYRRALDIVLDKDDYTHNLVAGILDGLAYTLGLDGKYDEAIGFVKRAIEIWEKEKSPEVGRGLTTLATINRDQGKYELAAKELHKAIAKFKEPYNAKEMTKAFFHLGLTLSFEGSQLFWFEDDEKEAMNSIKLAKEYYEKSKALAEYYNFNIELPRTLHHLGHVYWFLNDRDKAHETNEKAYQLSLKFRNVRYAIDCLVTKAEFEHDEGIDNRIPEYAKIMEKEYEKKEEYNFPLFYGRMRCIQADIAFQRKEYDNALNFYAKGIAQIKEGRYGNFFIKRELSLLEQNIDSLSPEYAINWLDRLKKHWEGEESDEPNSFLIDWCIQQIVRMKY